MEKPIVNPYDLIGKLFTYGNRDFEVVSYHSDRKRFFAREHAEAKGFYIENLPIMTKQILAGRVERIITG